MFVDVTLNEKTMWAMIDISTMHNFIKGTEALRLGFQLEKDVSCIKAVNIEERPIAGVAKNVKIVIGSWRGTTNLTVDR